MHAAAAPDLRAFVPPHYAESATPWRQYTAATIALVLPAVPYQSGSISTGCGFLAVLRWNAYRLRLGRFPQGIAAETPFEFTLSFPLESTAVAT